MTHGSSIIVIGNTDVTVAVLEAARDASLQIAAVVSNMPEFSISYSTTPVRNYRAVDVGGWCTAAGIRHHVYAGNDDLAALAGELKPALGLVAGWYHMVPSKVRKEFNLGCLGFHASLLPRLRGGAPLNWAILNGDDACGLSLFELTDGVDDGRLYAQRQRAIADTTTVGELVEWSRAECAALTRECIVKIIDGTLRPRPQIGEPTYGLQRAPEDGAIDWRLGAQAIYRLVRAVGRPYPGAFTALDGRKITIWAARPFPGPAVAGKPGQLFRLPGGNEVCVVTGSGLLQILEATSETGEEEVGRLARASQKRFAERP